MWTRLGPHVSLQTKTQVHSETDILLHVALSVEAPELPGVMSLYQQEVSKN